jgi:Tfp pilus assembly protein PilF
MRRSFLWQLTALLLFATAVDARMDDSAAHIQVPSNPPADVASSSDTTQAPPNPEITVTGKAPHDERALPALPPDEFTHCMQQNGVGTIRQNGVEVIDSRLLVLCSAKLNWERHTVIDKCINSDGKSTPPMVIQACTESLDHKILQGNYRFYVFVNRAEAYFAQGDKERALADYNSAINLAPQNDKLHYNRALFYAVQADRVAALADLNTALSINPRFVAALQLRAKLYLTQDNLGGALADYSEAVRLQPKTAALWSERGYIYIRQRDYDSAVKDEAEAIRLDPKLARAYFLRGAAFGDLGNSPNAVSDIVAAVSLDPSLDQYVSTQGKTTSIALPPL